MYICGEIGGSAALLLNLKANMTQTEPTLSWHRKLRKDLALVFDDNLETRKWKNVVDYTIIGVILLSTVEIFLCTFNITPQWRTALYWVDVFTLVFFTIEVTLRIWVAPELYPGLSASKARLRYILSTQGFIDVVSTYPYYLQWLLPMPISWIKVLRLSRTLRIFRVSRYMKSWRLLASAVREKRRELLISMQFLIVVTFILSIILYFCEHEAQPEAYCDGFSSVAWSFAQYIGDPGGFGDTPPITPLGKAIACIVGLLGIAIVAVPAGILGAGFTEAIEKESNREQLAENREKLRLSFQTVLDRPSGIQVVPPYRTLAHIQSRQCMTADEIIETVNVTPGYRLVNLSATIPIDKNPLDNLAVEHFAFNRPYGMLIDRNSPFTIIAPASFVDDCTVFFGYYLARIGGFNFVSREFGKKAPYRSFYLVPAGEPEEGFEEYQKDLEMLLARPGAWSLTYMIASGANEPEYPTQVHFGTGNPKGVTTTGDLITDKPRFEEFVADVAPTLEEKFGVKSDTGKYHASHSPKINLRLLHRVQPGNDIIMRIAWSAALWDTNRVAIAQTLADAINRKILGLPGNPDDPSLKTKVIGYV